MNASRSIFCLSTAALLGLAAWSEAQLPQPAPPAPVGRDQQFMIEAEKLQADGKYKEALDKYLSVQREVATSPYIPGANLGAGICYFFLKDYDKAVEAVSKNLSPAIKNVPPEVFERSAVLLPQILVTKAGELGDEQTTLREKTLKDAAKACDDFVTRLPQSPEVETALFLKGQALGAVGDFEGATVALKQALEKFPRSPTVMDTRFMLGLAYAQQGIKAVSNMGKNADPAARAALDESEKAFREIISARQDLVLMNRSFMQLGDVLALKGTLAAKESTEQTRLQEQALDMYRQVRSKDEVVAAQEARIRFYEEQRKAVAGDLARYRSIGRVVEKEREKLEFTKTQPDQALQGKLKAGQMFLAMGRFDEARVLLRFVSELLGDEDKDEKKRAEYFVCVTYLAQHLAEKGVEAYNKFKAAYPKDPLAENLGLQAGMMYLDQDPKINDPNKALKYFDDQINEYPTSKFSAAAIIQKAAALIQLQRFDDALKALQDFIQTSKDPELLADAEFNVAIVYREMGQADNAIATYKKVRDKYPNTPQSEQATFWIGQMSLAGGDAKTALSDLNAFIQKYPQSDLLPSAMYFKARALAANNDHAGAVKTYRELIAKFPQAEPSTASFFDIAGLLRDEADAAATKSKPDYTKVREVMQEFVSKYPDHEKVYGAFDFSAQLFVKEEKVDEAIKTYEDFIARFPRNPAVARAYLAIANNYKTRAEKLGAYLSLGAEDQKKWAADMEAALKNAEAGIEKFPESDAVSNLLDVALKIETVRMNIGLRKAEDVESYFKGLAAKFDATKGTKAKILFALAGFLRERDKEKNGKWFDIMDAAYDPALVFSPADLDVYGNALIDRKSLEKANLVFEKLAQDYPLPVGSDSTKITRTIGEGQSVSLAGRARVLRTSGKATEGQQMLEDLKRLYPWSAKVAEADFGIGAALYEQKKYAEAISILADVAKKITAPVSLRAKAMMLLAKSLQEQKAYNDAINNYVKIATFFESEAELAAEGLYLGAQLLEQQAAGKLPLKDPTLTLAKATPAPASKKPGATPPKPGAAPAKPAGASSGATAKK